MSRQEKKKSIGFMIFAILLSVILVVFAGFLIYQIFKLQILPDNILIPGILAIVLFSVILFILINFCAYGIIPKIIYSIFRFRIVKKAIYNRTSAFRLN